jgi:nucleoside-diphosphate-sugar epimerase
LSDRLLEVTGTIDEQTPFRPTNPYAVSKITQDYLALQYTIAHDLEIIRVRPFNHIGSGQSAQFVVSAFAKQIAEIEKGKKEPILRVGNIETKRDFTDVRDMVKAYGLILEKGDIGEVYNIGTGKAYKISDEIGATLVHYSTDYVFDGTNQEGYAEDAEPHPLSRYGMTKREGELAVLAVPGRHFVIRLSKLFGKPALSIVGKQSFFEKILSVAEGKTEVSVVDGERSCFTYAPDLARATRELMEDRSTPGIYHLANSGAI